MVKASGSATHVYAVDEAGRPLGVYIVDAAQPNGYRVEEEYVHLDGWRPVAVVRPDPNTGMANPQIFPILTDHLGTPRKVLDGATGVTRWSWDAKQPFGHEMPNETPPAGQAAFRFDLRFPGQRFDEETGLFHNGFRDYHPGLGRYVQSDPLGLEAGWNTFAYANSAAPMSTDPYGLLSWRDIAKVSTPIPYFLMAAQLPHEYSGMDYVCDTSTPFCSLDRARSALSKYAYPGQNPSKPVGAVPTARNVYFPSSCGNLGPGQPILASFDGQTAINRTVPGHVFLDGYVERTIEQVGGKAYIKTYGYGTNNGAILWLMNMTSWKSAFSPANQAIKKSATTGDEK